MTDEEKEALLTINNIECRRLTNDEIESIVIIDKLIEKQLKEIKKKDKQIDLMSEQLAGLAIWSNSKDDTIILKDKEEVKQYFEKEASKDES